jgi:acetolactate synthase-1/2/3 large subunit
VHRFYQYRGYRTELGPTSGAMGYGLPAAVAAKAVYPDRTVVCFAGDGCFLMNGQELATAVQYGLAIIVIVVNNGMYGTIRMHQEREYPERVHGTDLKNPDFAALARAYGAHGELVETTGQFAPAFERALASGKPALLELRLDPDAITPRMGLADIRANALKARKN